MKVLVLILAALPLNGAWAQSHCKAQFKRNLQEIQKRSKSMRPICWREVQRGSDNSSRIMTICNDNEVALAQSMENFERRNVALCEGSCSGELNAVKVCVDGRPLSYYLSQLK